MTIKEVVESSLDPIVNPFMSKQRKTDSDWKTDKYKEALAYLDILANGSGTPISAEEDGKGAGVEMYAQLMHNFLTINYQNILCGFNSVNRYDLSCHYKQNKPIATTHIDLNLDSEKLNHIKVMLGPLTTEADKIIVESLLSPFPDCKLYASNFKVKIRNKHY